MYRFEGKCSNIFTQAGLIFGGGDISLRQSRLKNIHANQRQQRNLEKHPERYRLINTPSSSTHTHVCSITRLVRRSRLLDLLVRVFVPDGPQFVVGRCGEHRVKFCDNGQQI